MSVKTWKKIITITVLLTIILLIITTTVSKHKYINERDKILPENMVDLADYGIETVSVLDKYENFINYYTANVSVDAIDYQSKYPDLYVDNEFKYEDNSDKMICYLTFDDGPYAPNTEMILDALKKYDAKATFFVVCKDTEENRRLLKRMVEEGHTIGVHTACHDYYKIYESVEAYLTDFKKVSDWVEDVTGTKPEIFRFPGGSVSSYNIAIYQDIIAEMLRRGYTYYDWNCSSGDAAAGYVSESRIQNNVVNTANVNKKVVLMHDGRGHGTSAKSVEPILRSLTAKGYEFRALDKTVEPVIFDY